MWAVSRSSVLEKEKFKEKNSCKRTSMQYLLEKGIGL